MDVTLEELALHILRRNDLSPGGAQQISLGGDIEQLVVQLGGQAQVAQHQTRLRGKAVQQLLLHRRQPLTLAFLDDEYAQQLTAVPDGADVAAGHRRWIVGELRWGGRFAVTLGVDRGKPNSTTGHQPHLDPAGTHPRSENLRHPHRRLLRRGPTVRCEMGEHVVRQRVRTTRQAVRPRLAASVAQVRTPPRRSPWRPPTAAGWARPSGPRAGPRRSRPRRRPHRRRRPDRPGRARCSRRRPREDDRHRPRGHQPLISAVCSRFGNRDRHLTPSCGWG